MTRDTLTISKSKLKAQMLEIFRHLEETGQEAIVTDRGRPVLRLVPIAQRRSVEELFGPFRGQVTFHEDPCAPTSDEWASL